MKEAVRFKTRNCQVDSSVQNAIPDKKQSHVCEQMLLF